MLCPECGKDVADGSAYCPECGHCFTPATPTCPNCHAPIREGQKFCTDCGQPLEAEPTATAKTQPTLAQPAQPTVALFCSHCGGPLREGQAICLQCGFYTPFAGKRQRTINAKKGGIPFSRGDAILFTVCFVLILGMMFAPVWFVMNHLNIDLATGRAAFYTWSSNIFELPYEVDAAMAFFAAIMLIPAVVLVWVGYGKQKGYNFLPWIFTITATLLTLASLIISSAGDYYAGDINKYGIHAFSGYSVGAFCTPILLVIMLALITLHMNGKSFIESKQ